MTRDADDSAERRPLGEPFPDVTRAEWRSRVEGELGDADFEAALVSTLPGGHRVEPLYTDPVASPALDLRRRQGAWLRCGRGELTGREPSRQALALAVEQIAADLAGGCHGVWLATESPQALAAVLAEADLAGSSLFVDTSGWSEEAPDATRVLLEATPAVAGDGRTVGLGIDPIGALLAGGSDAARLAGWGEALAEVVAECERRGPDVLALTVSAQRLHEAGASPAQELGWALANLAAYLRLGEEAGLAPEQIAPRVELRVAMERDGFAGVAKLRALRVLWTRLLCACGVASPPAAFVHALPSERSLTRHSARLNLVRVAGQVWSAVCGAADAVTAAPWDEALSGASASARRLARNTQVILAEEAHLARSLDPGAGSYYLEALTDDLARAAWSELQRIEAGGGALEHVASGRLRAEVDEAWARRAASVEAGELAIVGVTVYPDPDEGAGHEALRPEPAAPDRPVPLPRRRDEDAWKPAGEGDEP